MDIKKNWYEKELVMYEILRSLKKKEIVILGDKRVRCIKAKNIYQLKQSLKGFKFVEGDNNLYYSLANINMDKFCKDYEIPIFSFKPELRRDQMDLFNREIKNYVEDYELVFDFDNHDGTLFLKVYAECHILKEIFDNYEIPYSIRFSGSGFHISVKHENLPDHIKEEKDIDKKIDLIRQLATDVQLIFNLTTLDIGTDKKGNYDGSFYDIRRIIKVPYTIDYKTGNVCLPLTDNEFNNFDHKFVKSEYILKNMNVFNRGLLYREGTSKNFNNFCKGELGYDIKKK